MGGQFLEEKSVLQSTIDCKEEKSPERQTWIPPTKNQNSPKSTKTEKNTKIVRMTSYLQVGLSKKSAAQKYRVSIFRTNEGDFSGTPVKNQ